MKIISKQKLDALIELVRELCDAQYEEGNVDRLIKEGIAVAKGIEDDVNESTGVAWNGPYDLVWSILHGKLKADATNEDIYKVLGLLGWGIQYEA